MLLDEVILCHAGLGNISMHITDQPHVGDINTAGPRSSRVLIMPSAFILLESHVSQASFHSEHCGCKSTQLFPDRLKQVQICIEL